MAGLAALVLTWGTLSVACGGGRSGRNVSFSADLISILHNNHRTITARLYRAPGKFRLEMKTSGRAGGNLVTIGRQDLGRGWVVFPSMKRYHEIPLDRAESGKLFFKPAPDQIVERLGTETVAGYRCEKLRIRGGGPGSTTSAHGTLTVWISSRFPMPLRSRTAGGDITELRNIEVGPQPAELFELPDGSTEMAPSLPSLGGGS